MFKTPPKGVAGQCRHDYQRHHQGGQHSQHDGDRHGLEQLSLHPLQGEQGCEDHDDDEHSEKDRAADLACRLLDAQRNAVVILGGIVGILFHSIQGFVRLWPAAWAGIGKML